jgi:hypothetical protein
MRRIGIVLWVVLAVVLVRIGFIWMERRASDNRFTSRLFARHHRETAPGASAKGTAVKITQFYPRVWSMPDTDHNTICYGVENAKSVRLEPPIANVWPTVNRCFWAEARQDTTYKLIAEGFDGTSTSESFSIHVTPTPPSITFMAVSHKEIQKGDAVTVCYGVANTKTVKLQPINWPLPAIAKNCVRFYPPASLNYKLIATGAGGEVDSDRFSVKVRQ